MWPSRQPSSPRGAGQETESRLEGRLVVLVDHATTRRRVCARLAATGYLVLADGIDADSSALVHDLRPELVVVEWRGPNDVVTTAVGAPAGRGPVTAMTEDGPAWIALVSDDPLLRAAALACGFDDVVASPHDPHEVVDRVGAVLARRRRRSRLQFADVTVDLDAHEVLRDGQAVSLTTTEFRLLVTLFRHPHQVLSKRQLLELVWGFDDYDANVVEVQVSALRRKLEVWGPRLIHTVRGVGYVARQGVPSTSTITP